MIRPLTLDSLLADHAAAAVEARRDGVCARTAADRLAALSLDELRWLLSDVVRRLPRAADDDGIADFLGVAADVAADEAMAGQCEEDLRAVAITAAKEMLEPSVRLALAVELLAPLGGSVTIGIDGASAFDALVGQRHKNEWIEGRMLMREADYLAGSVRVVLGASAPVTAADVKRITEG